MLKTKSYFSGDIYINGSHGPTNVKNNMSLIYKDIGYCPQFDGLLDQISGAETLRIIGLHCYKIKK